MRQAVFAGILAALALPALTGGPAGALLGADIADRTVQRYTVALASAKGRCSGVVLAQNVVLTAAHCIQGASNLQVGGNLGGEQRALPPSMLSAVSEIVQHPLYRPKDAGSPDLAILKLAKPLPDQFIPAALNSRELKTGDDLIAAGYGKGAANDTKAGTVLRMVLLRVSQTIRGWVILASVREDASGGAPGDSGGPVFAYRGMYSLVALIVGVSENRTKAVALAAHYGWIRETVEKLSAP
jgi:hypothetical protein